MSGSTTRHETRWLPEVPRSLLFDDCIAIADRIGVRRKQEETVFGIKLGRLVPNLGQSRRSAEVRDEIGVTMVRRVRCYLLPSLEQRERRSRTCLGNVFHGRARRADRTAIAGCWSNRNLMADGQERRVWPTWPTSISRLATKYSR
jgi:hypothetical protein